MVRMKVSFLLRLWLSGDYDLFSGVQSINMAMVS
jgi:hypothetical protein